MIKTKQIQNNNIYVTSLKKTSYKTFVFRPIPAGYLWLLFINFIVWLSIGSVNADVVNDRQNLALKYNFNYRKNVGDPPSDIVWAFCCLALANSGDPDVNSTDIALASQLMIDASQSYPDPADDDNMYWVIPHMARMLAEPGISALLTSSAKEAIKNMLHEYVDWRDDIANAATDEATLWLLDSSENHDIHRKVVFLLTSQVFKNNPAWSGLAYHDGYTAEQHHQAWTGYFLEYFKQRAMRGIQVEFAATPYAGVFLDSVMLISDSAENGALRWQAEKFLDLCFTDIAIETIKGVRGGAKVRTYKDYFSYSYLKDKTVYFSWLFSGQPDSSAFSAGNVPSELIPACISDYRLPNIISRLYSNNSARGTFEYITSRPGRGYDVGYDRQIIFPSYIRRQTYVTPNFSLGTFTLDEDLEYSILIKLDHWMGLIAADDYSSRIYMTTAGSTSDPRTGIEDLQAVSGKGAMIFRRNNNIVEDRNLRVFISDEFTFSEDTVSEWIFGVNSGSSVYFAMYATDGGSSRYSISEAPESGKWVTFTDKETLVVFDVVLASHYTSYESFQNSIKGNTLVFNNSNELEYHSSYGDEFLFYRDNTIPKLNGVTVDLNPQKTYDSLYLTADYNSPIVTIRDYLDNQKILNFNYCSERLFSDLNEDCIVNLTDFAIFAQQWIFCTDITVSNCVPVE